MNKTLCADFQTYYQVYKKLQNLTSINLFKICEIKAEIYVMH